MWQLGIILSSVAVIVVGVIAICYFEPFETTVESGSVKIQWHKWQIFGELLGILATGVGCVVLYSSAVPVSTQIQASRFFGSPFIDSVHAKPEIRWKEGRNDAVAWNSVPDAIWFAVTEHHETPGETQTTSVKGGQDFLQKESLARATKVTVWFATPNGPSGLSTLSRHTNGAQLKKAP